VEVSCHHLFFPVCPKGPAATASFGFQLQQLSASPLSPASHPNRSPTNNCHRHRLLSFPLFLFCFNSCPHSSRIICRSFSIHSLFFLADTTVNYTIQHLCTALVFSLFWNQLFCIIIFAASKRERDRSRRQKSNVRPRLLFFTATTLPQYMLP